MSAHDLHTDEMVKRLMAGRHGGSDPVKYSALIKAAADRLTRDAARLQVSHETILILDQKLADAIRELSASNTKLQDAILDLQARQEATAALQAKTSKSPRNG